MNRGILPALCALCALFGIDAVGVTSRSALENGWAAAVLYLGAALYGLSLGLLPGLVLNAAARWLVHVPGGASRSVFSRSALRLDPGVRAGELAAVSAVFLLGGVAGFYWLGLQFAAQFHNRELSALLLASLVVAYLLGGALLVNRLTPLLAGLRLRRPRLARALLALLWLLAANAAAYLVWDNWSGFLQLDSFFGRSLVGATLVYAAAGAGLRRREPSSSLARGVWASAVLGFVLGSLVAGRAVTAVAQRGSVSRYLLFGLRRSADVDGDGYAGLWAGGDCAAFDAFVHPGAVEIPGDGLDNNCFGGDVKTSERGGAPRWASIPAGVVERPNLLLITIETLRADAVGFLAAAAAQGREYPRTPRLDALAAESLVFERFFASTPWTRLSLPSILASSPPTRIPWGPRTRSGRPRPVSHKAPWLPEVLQQEGYRTVAVLNSFSAFTASEDLGFERGFDVYDVSTRLSYIGGTMKGHIGRAQARRVARYLEQSRGQPFFLWLHLMEPHYRYERSARAPNFGDAPRDLYASEVWEADAVVGEVLNKLQALGLKDRTIVTVVGDHAEEFGEHGSQWHGASLLQTQVHTPLLLRVPGLVPGRMRTAVNHADLVPTWLNLMGIKRGFERWRGRNLLHLVHGDRLERDHFFLERYEVKNGRQYTAAIVYDPFKLIYDEEGREFQLYDLSADPEERHPESPRGAAEEALKQLLMQHVDGAKR